MTDDNENQNNSSSWQPYPTGRYKLRWRDETGDWTHHVYSNEGELGSDPYPHPPVELSQEEERPSSRTRSKTLFEEREAQRKAKHSAKRDELQQRLADQKTHKAARREAIKSASGKIEKLLALARPHLDDIETPLHSVLGTYETKVLGSDSVRKGTLIATDKRVVFYAKRVTGHDINFFRYKAISFIDTGRNMMGAYITLVVSGNEAHLKWISGDATGFVEIVQDQMEDRV